TRSRCLRPDPNVADHTRLRIVEDQALEEAGLVHAWGTESWGSRVRLLERDRRGEAGGQAPDSESAVGLGRDRVGNLRDPLATVLVVQVRPVPGEGSRGGAVEQPAGYRARGLESDGPGRRVGDSHRDPRVFPAVLAESDHLA